MKKSLVAVLLVLTMLFAFAVPAFASVEGKLSATSTTSSDGKTLTVNLSISGNSGFVALTVDAKYNDKVLKLKSATNGKVFEDIFVASKTLDVNPYRLLWLEATVSEDIKTNGVLATYTFEILNPAAVNNTEIVFQVKEVSNLAGDTEAKITPCTFKPNAKNEVGSDSQANSNLQTTSKNEASSVQKPTTDGDSNAIVSDDTNVQIDDDITIGATTEPEGTTEADPQEKSNLTTVIVILAVLVLGSAVVLVIVLKKKKKEK